MAQTEKGSEVKDFTADPIDSDKILGFKTSDGTRWFTLSRFMNWLKTKTASTVTSGDKTPVNSDAVNGALTNYSKLDKYKSEETLTNKCWFGDNANVKRKVYTNIDLSQGEIEVATITARNVINLYGYAQSEDTWVKIPRESGLDVFVVNNKITISSDGYLNFKAVIIVEYV